MVLKSQCFNLCPSSVIQGVFSKSAWWKKARTSRRAGAYTKADERKEAVGMPIRIFIDQGHNPQGVNAGAEGFGLREQDVNYAVGMELALSLIHISEPTRH